MAISMDWGNFWILVPKGDLTPLGGLFYFHDTENFLRELQDLAASEEGIAHPVPYNHNPVVTLSGVDYARVVEILAPYQVVYDDSGGTDAYNVNLGGSNNNILDRKFPNLVSVNPNNSAGLTDVSGVTTALDYSGKVHLNPVTGSAGTNHPTGTPLAPVDNFADAIVIAATYGLHTIEVEGDTPVVLDVDVSGLAIEASTGGGTVVLSTGNDVTGTVFERLFISGAANISGPWYARTCGLLDGLTGVAGQFIDCGIFGKVYLGGDVMFSDCVSGIAGVAHSGVDGGSSGSLTAQFRRYTGGLDLYNFVTGDTVSVDLLPGILKIESSVTGGEFKVRGIGEPLDLQGTPDILDDDGFVAGADVQLTRKLLANRQEVLDIGGGSTVIRTFDDDAVSVFKDQTAKDPTDAQPTLVPGSITKRGTAT